MKWQKYFLLISLFLFSFAFVSATYWESSLDNENLGYFSCDDGSGTTILNNVSGSVNGAIAQGSFLSVGKLGGGLDLSNNGDYAIAPTYYGDYWNYSDGYTFHSWLYNDDFPSTVQLTGSRQGGNKLSVGIDTGGKAYAVFWQLSPVVCESALGVTPTNEWFMFDLTYNLTQVNIYINNEKVATCDVTGEFDVSDGYNTPIGYDGDDPAYNWKGYMDEIGFWGRGLTEYEINLLWNNASGIYYQQPYVAPEAEEEQVLGIIKFWDFDKLENQTTQEQSQPSITGGVISQSTAKVGNFFSRLWQWILQFFK